MGDVIEKYIYDEDNFLIEKRILSAGQETFEKLYRDPETKMIVAKDDGMQKVYYEYDEQYQLIKESTDFGSTEYSYDLAGRTIWKRFPLGALNEYEYDSFGNLIRVKEVGAAEKRITYNEMNLPIICEINGRASFNTYDHKGRLLKEVSHKRAITSYAYDEFDNCIKKTLPIVEVDGFEVAPTWHYEYDALGNVIKETSPSGKETQIAINRNHKVITYPDGTKEGFMYYGNQCLHKRIFQDDSCLCLRRL